MTCVGYQGNDHIAIDGKTLRRSFKNGQRKDALHMLSVWASKSELFFSGARSEGKKNEVKSTVVVRQEMYKANPHPQANRYLGKHQLAPLQIHAPINPDLGCVVVIPCRDEPDVLDTLLSLSACRPPDCAVEVLLVINGSAAAEAAERRRNLHSAAQAKEFAASAQCPAWLCIHVLSFLELDPNAAGVGLARRLGMDEAVARLYQAGRDDAPIIGLDADCRVADNYLQRIVEYFRQTAKINACSIYFEHPLHGPQPPQVYTAIAEYELYLRYYRHALLSSGYPFAHHTLGSCMAVRSHAYQRCGGMNRRQAAEDFHFLSKLMLQGGYGDLNQTVVYPDARPSHRVPFGTGHAVTKRLHERVLQVYAPEVFSAISSVVRAVPIWAEQDSPRLLPEIEAYFVQQGLAQRLVEVRRETASRTAFEKRLYRWLNPLWMVKFANYLSACWQPRIPVFDAASRLLHGTAPAARETTAQTLALLDEYRALERPTDGACRHAGK